MTFLHKTTQIVTVLFVLLMSMMLALPAGMDVEFCFGNNGHVDFSLSNCKDDVLSKFSAKEQPSIHNTEHHGECRDVAVACNTTQEFIRTYGKSGSLKSEQKNDPSKISLFFSELLADSSEPYIDPNAYPAVFKDFPSAHLLSLGTIVILI